MNILKHRHTIAVIASISAEIGEPPRFATLDMDKETRNSVSWNVEHSIIIYDHGIQALIVTELDSLDADLEERLEDLAEKFDLDFSNHLDTIDADTSEDVNSKHTRINIIH